MEKRVINPWTWQDQYGYVQANEVTAAQRVLYCSGQVSVDAEGNPVHQGDMQAQLGKALDNLETVLGSADFELTDVVKMTVFTTDINQFFEGVGAIQNRLAQAECRFASTLVEVSTLAFPGLLVEIEATAVK